MEIEWLGAFGVADTEGWTRGVAQKRMVVADRGERRDWVAVTYVDSDGHWFRGGKFRRAGTRRESPEFYGPYATEDEARRAAELAFRMGALE